MTGEQAAVTAQLCQWAATLDSRQLPPAVLHHAKRCIIDFWSACLPGSTAAPARIVQDHLVTTMQSGPSSVYGTKLTFSAEGAALANGTAAHSLEIDDGHTAGSFHPGASVLSAVLAVTEAQKHSASELLSAIVVGYEVSCRLAAAIHPAARSRGFHITPIAGVMGSAAAVARLQGADPVTMEHALGLAASHAGGLFAFLGQGAEVKRLHAGTAARDGVICVDLALRGLTGPRAVLEGPLGFAWAFSGTTEVAHVLDDLGSAWMMLDTYNKPYPCCRHLHGPIDAVLALRESTPLDVDTVTGIRVETYGLAAGHDQVKVRTLLDAQMSIPFAVAVALAHGAPSLASFGARCRSDPTVLRLVDLVNVCSNDRCDRDYPVKRPVRLVLQTSAGDHTHDVDQPYGEPENPMSDTALEHKLRELAEPVIGQQRCRSLLHQIWDLDDPAQMLALVGPSAT